jgi:hypothetical protein
VTLLALALGLYYGIPIGSVYVRYWRLNQEIKTQARLAPSIDNATIVRRIRRKVDELGLPEEARQVSVRRTLRPREIVIKTGYEETIELPFFSYTFALAPEVKSPL